MYSCEDNHNKLSNFITRVLDGEENLDIFKYYFMTLAQHGITSISDNITSISDNILQNDQ